MAYSGCLWIAAQVSLCLPIACLIHCPKDLPDVQVAGSMDSLVYFVFLVLISSAVAQNVTVPSTCSGEYSTSGVDTVLYTVPYTYDQVLSIIGNYQNLTWSGNPIDTVKLNGTTNTVGTARTYDILGAHLVETITYYSKPPAPGPYQEIHTTALLNVPSFSNVSFYLPYDGTIVSSVCDGKASQFNFTARYCTDNGTAAAAVLSAAHMSDAITVGKFLGGQNYTDCAALGASNSSGPPNATASGNAPSSTVLPSSNAVRLVLGPLASVVAVLVAAYLF